MATSVVKPRRCASSAWGALVQWQMLILLVPEYLARRLSAEYSASAGRSRRWSWQHLSSMPFAMKLSSSACTLTTLPVRATSAMTSGISESSLKRMFPVVEPMKSLKAGTYGARRDAWHPGVRAANSP